MRRRELLKGGGLALGASLLPFPPAGRGGAAEEAAAPARPLSPDSSWEEVRGEFDLDPTLVHMAGFYLASHPRSVRAAIERHRRGFEADPAGYLDGNSERSERGLRRAAAEYLAAQPDTLAITDSTTMGLGLVYGGLELAAGQEILTTTHDHVSSLMALTFRARRTGAPLRQVALYDAPATATADSIVERFAAAVGPRTRVVAVTWVHSGTGVKLPIRRLAEALARRNADRDPADRALLFVDGVHGFGVDDETVESLGCDAFIAGTHKWIFGPRGTGLVWANPAAWAATAPTIVTFDPMWRHGDPQAMPAAAWMTPGGFKAFEHRWAVEEAFDFHLALDKSRVAERIRGLVARTRQGLAEMPRVRVATPAAADLSAGILCFEVDGLDPRQVVAGLRRRGIVASVTPGFYERSYARLAPGLLTLEADVERTLVAVRAL